MPQTQIPPPPDGSAIVAQGVIPPPPDGSAVIAQGASGGQPGWLDKQIPLDSYTHATEQGLQTIGKGIRDAAVGTYNIVRHPIDTAKGIAALPSQAAQVPAAVSDINESPDPVGTYAKVAQETAGQGAGQALVALGTAGVGKALPTVADALNTARGFLAEKAVAPLVKTPLGMSLENAKFGRDPAAAITNEGLIGSKTGLIEQAGKRIGELSDATDQTLQNHPNANTQIDTAPIIDKAISDAQASARKVGNKAAVTRLSDLQDALKTEYGPIKGTPFEMNNLKRSIGDAASQLGAFKYTDPLEASAAGAMGDVYTGIKNAVNEQVPEVVPLNERVADLLSAKTALTRNALMESNKSLLDSHTMFNLGAKALKSTIASAPVRTGVARLLNVGNTLEVPEGVTNATAETTASPENPSASLPSQSANGRTGESTAVHESSQPSIQPASGARTNLKVTGTDQSIPAQYEVRELEDVKPFNERKIGERIEQLLNQGMGNKPLQPNVPLRDQSQ